MFSYSSRKLNVLYGWIPPEVRSLPMKKSDSRWSGGISLWNGRVSVDYNTWLLASHSRQILTETPYWVTFRCVFSWALRDWQIKLRAVVISGWWDCQGMPWDSRDRNTRANECRDVLSMRKRESWVLKWHELQWKSCFWLEFCRSKWVKKTPYGQVAQRLGQNPTVRPCKGRWRKIYPCQNQLYCV